MKGKVKRTNVSNVIFYSLTFFLMALFALSFLFILIYMVLNSLRTSESYGENPLRMFEFAKYTIEGYKTAFEFTMMTTKGEYSLMGMIGNTLIVVAGCVFLNTFYPSITGYIVAKYNFKFKSVMNGFALFRLVIPTVGSTVTTFVFIHAIGLYNSFGSIFLLSSSGLTFGYFIFKNYYSSIPIEYMEAGYLDGAGEWKIFTKLMLPQALPVMISIAIMQFIAAWNDYFTPYLYIPDRPTLALGVNEIYTRYASLQYNYPPAFAAMTVTTAVILVIYAFCSKTIMESMSVGGLKG